MSKPIKVGLLTHAGGAHVDHYLKALVESKLCGEVVLADPDEHWNAKAAQTLGSKFKTSYRDYQQLLKAERPEMVLVTIEARLAPPVIDASLDAGCHVFAEKPACVKVDDFAALVDKADRQHRYLMLALANRLNGEFLAAQQLVSSGQIGDLYGLTMHLVADQTRLKSKSYHKKWYAQKSRAGGGHLIWLGIHWLDLAMQLTGSSIDQVAGFIANVGGQPLDVEDSASATMHFENGILGNMTSGFYLDRGYHSQIKLWGSEGWLQLEQMKEMPLQWYSHKGAKAGQIQHWDGVKKARGYTPFVRAAVQACAEMSTPPISNADSLRALKTVHAIYDAAREGKTVAIDS